MSMEVAKILLDPTTTTKTFKKVLNMNDMQVVEKFSPVISEYKIQLSPKLRQILTLTEDEFISKEQRFRYGHWQDSVEFRTRGPLKKLEQDLLICIENINNYAARHKKTCKHLKSF